MIKVIECTNTDKDYQTYKIVAFSDTKAEVASTDMHDYVGMPSKAQHIEMESIMITADGDVAFMKSDEVWNWV